MSDRRKDVQRELQEIGGQEHAEHVQGLHDELDREEPRPAVLAEHFKSLESHPTLGAKLTAWWNNPKTQAFIAELNGMGI